MRKKFIRLIVAVCLFSLLPAYAYANVLVMGSDVSVTFGKAVAGDFMEKNMGTNVTVLGGGKDTAIVMLSAGSCDLANSTLSLSEQDRPDVLKAIADAKAKGHPIREIAVAIDVVQFFIHPSNPINQLSLGQLSQIYLGKAINWDQVVGSHAPMEVLITSNDPKNFTLNNWVLDHQPAGANVLEWDKKLIFHKVAATPNAIGYDGIYFTNDMLALSGDLVKPITITASDNEKAYAPSRKYPISRNLYLFYREGDLSQEAQRYVDYMLSPAGQRIVGQYVLPLLPPAKTFELVFAPKGAAEQRVVFTEGGIPSTVSFQYTDASSYTFYARNNTRYDATFPLLTTAAQGRRNLVNEGYYSVLKPGSTGKTQDKLVAGDITELSVTGGSSGLASADVMTFAINGKTVTATFTKGSMDETSGSSGCNTAVFPALTLVPLFFLLRRKSR